MVTPAGAHHRCFIYEIFFFFPSNPLAALLSTRPGGERGEVGLRLTRPAPRRSSGPRRGPDLWASPLPAGLHQPLAPCPPDCRRRNWEHGAGEGPPGPPARFFRSPRSLGGARRPRSLRAPLGRSCFPGSASLLFPNFPTLSKFSDPPHYLYFSPPQGNWKVMAWSRERMCTDVRFGASEHPT